MKMRLWFVLFFIFLFFSCSPEHDRIRDYIKQNIKVGARFEPDNCRYDKLIEETIEYKKYLLSTPQVTYVMIITINDTITRVNYSTAFYTSDFKANFD